LFQYKIKYNVGDLVQFEKFINKEFDGGQKNQSFKQQKTPFGKKKKNPLEERGKNKYLLRE